MDTTQQRERIAAAVADKAPGAYALVMPGDVVDVASAMANPDERVRVLLVGAGRADRRHPVLQLADELRHLLAAAAPPGTP